MKRSTTLLRALLVLLLLVLLGALGIIDLVRVQAEEAFPELAWLGWPTYIGIVLGFLPVVLALWRMFVLAGLVARDEAFSVDTVAAIRQIKHYIVWFMLWFVGGLIASRIAFGQVGPPIGALWFLLEVAALFLYVVVAILERLFIAATHLREDAELTV